MTKLFMTSLLLGTLLTAPGFADEPNPQVRIDLDASNLIAEQDTGDPSGLVDEQHRIIGPPAGEPQTTWSIPSQEMKNLPFSVQLDFKQVRNVATLWLYDTNGRGELEIAVGQPGQWRTITTYGCDAYRKWVPIQIDASTRFIRLTKLSRGANFSEVAVYEYTPEAHAAMLARKEAEAKAEAERQAALEKAREEMKKRPLVDVGPPFGKLYLIDEIDVASSSDEHMFAESPAGVSRVETILGKPARVLQKTDGEAAYISYRIGRYKLLEPGMTYVLEVQYPEDAPRTVIVMNGGNESVRGFHTGRTFGDALHPKYVNNLNESLDLPLSGQHETWTQMFRLHDRTPDKRFIRGSKTRELTAEDGFTVTIAQFSAKNIPFSQGAAVSRIRLLAVPEPEIYDAQVRLPEDLPHRRLFWREEMADGVIGSKNPEERGLENDIDWWRFKRDRMKFLGMNTYSKDLLEFGANQHWDPTEYGGNDWVYHNSRMKGFWAQIVEVMGEAGFEVLPYYEYSGSKGKNGLGPQKRARPLTRGDAYSHIRWIESARADLTDPDTYEDFKKMLDLTVLRHQRKADFAGAWIRTRGQMPIGFGDATLERFAREANQGNIVTRQQLIDDPTLLERYKAWWYEKRRDFFTAMRDHLRSNGVEDAAVIYTPVAGEPGVPFPTFDPWIVTDDVETLRDVLGQPRYLKGNGPIEPWSLSEVVQNHRYLEALLADRLNWGGWELNHRTPPPDPHRYKDTEGVLMTMAFNRAYTVKDPKAFETFRGPAGLAIIRHFSLNENMMFDKEDEEKLGYFVADMERAGPYCMMAEALAMANGDPTHIGYLSGGNYARGFPHYVRSFNTAFLALPALPSRRLDGVANDSDIVVRAIDTPDQGVYYAVINTGVQPKDNVVIELPATGQLIDAATGDPVDSQAGRLSLSMHPFQLRAFHAP